MINSRSNQPATAVYVAGGCGRVWWRRLIRNRSLAIGGALTAAVFLTAIAAPVLAPHDPLAVHPQRTLEAPSREFWLGTDDLGRDNLSQDIYGTRLSLQVGLGSVALGITGGVPWGLVSGYSGGTSGYLLMRVAELVLVFPSLVLALVIRALLGPGVLDLVVAIGVTLMPALARVVRGEVLSIRERDFVTAAVATGARESRILIRQVLPNVLEVIVVLGAVYTGRAILTEASLSFLGFGAPPPAPSWGRILSEGFPYLALTPWPSLTAGAALFVTILAVYLVGDGARRVLHRDPA